MSEYDDGLRDALDSRIAELEAEVARLREALRDITVTAERFEDATTELISDSDYDRDGGLAESQAHLTVTSIPRAKAILAEPQEDKHV